MSFTSYLQLTYVKFSVLYGVLEVPTCDLGGNKTNFKIYLYVRTMMKILPFITKYALMCVHYFRCFLLRK